MRLLMLLACIALSPNLRAQSGTFETYLDSLGAYYGSSVFEWPDGSIVVGGSRYTPAAAQDCFLAKLDSTGNVQWMNVYGTPTTDGVTALAKVNDSTFLAAAIWNTTPPSGNDIRLMWLDDQGVLLRTWTGRIGAGDNFCERVMVLDNGDIVLTGVFTNPPTSGATTAFIRRLDSAGASRWTKTYQHQDFLHPYAIDETADGGFLLAGALDSAGLPRQFLMKLNGNGDSLWTLAWSVNDVSLAYSLAQSSDNGIVVGSNVYYPGLNYQIEITKFDSSGQLLWTTVLGDSRDNIVRDVFCFSNSEIGIVGSYDDPDSSGQAYFARLDPNGDSLEVSVLGGIGSEVVWRGDVTRDDGFLGVGITEGTFTAVSAVYLVKTNAHGQLTSIHTISLPEEAVVVHPNPASGTVRVTSGGCDLTGERQLNFYDIHARLVRREMLPPDCEALVNRKDMPAGLYFLQLLVNGTEVWTGRLVWLPE